MATQQPIYLVSIHGAGPGYHAAYAGLEASTHLDLGPSYLVYGDEARIAILAHDGQGDVHVTATLAGAGAIGDSDHMEADTIEIEAFLSQVTGSAFLWDERASRWSLRGYTPGGAEHAAAGTHREAVLAALRAVLATQKR